MPRQEISSLDRRSFVGLSTTASMAALTAASLTHADEPNTNADGEGQQNQPQRPRPTRFQVACMTLPYSRFSLQRALTGIKNAGFRYVAWGTTHMENGNRTPVLATDANPRTARDLGQRCRNLGLTPVMMFSTIYPEARNAVEVLTNRIRQAAAAQIPQVLTFGHTRGGNRRLWIQRLRQLGRVAADNNVTLVVKQHGGTTGTGTVLAEITREVNHANIKVNYDAGNVMDYLNMPADRIYVDLCRCASEVRSFCIKDHRQWPRDQDCGPGLGEIDHYRLLHEVAFTGRTMPLCCENIFAPVIDRPTTAAGVDALAKRAKEFLDLVIQAVQHQSRQQGRGE